MYLLDNTDNNHDAFGFYRDAPNSLNLVKPQCNSALKEYIFQTITIMI